MPLFELDAAAADALIAQIDGDGPTGDVLIETRLQLQARGSTGPAPK